ncbi:BTB/POZ domain-containing protein [Acorus gramineus]|uniref:BTB/POZ domain-containing protein n=1 Tax=Acorus gramineus TaxID=55184 RepID=A0AAV9A435_ACOGR|nr:BTB/POZ domain-containing protein [Acorus gramineus]
MLDHFIDRNPDCFFVLLDLLCKGELHPSPSPWRGSSTKRPPSTPSSTTSMLQSSDLSMETASATSPPTPVARRAHGDGTAIRATLDDAGPPRCVFFFP